MLGVVKFLGLKSLAAVGVMASVNMASAQMSTLCKFSSGQFSGQTINYAPMPAVPVGTPCHDGQGGQGIVVAAGSGGLGPNQGSNCSISTICTFSAGPRAGQSQDYAPMAGIPVGSACHDGRGSTGTVVAAQGCSGQSGIQQSGSSTLCRFDAGLRRGQVQDYAPMAPLPVGTPCHDGYGSTGVVSAASQSAVTHNKSQTCHYHAGPNAGKLQFFPSVQPVSVGIPCWDGVSSTGLTVPDQVNNPFQSAWNGDPNVAAPTVAPPTMAPTQPISPEPTPLEVGKRCALSSGGDPTAMGTCIVQNLPNNVAQQCLANPGACFGQLDPIYWNITVLNKAAEVLGIDLSKPAQFADEVFGGIRDVIDFF